MKYIEVIGEITIIIEGTPEEINKVLSFDCEKDENLNALKLNAQMTEDTYRQLQENTKCE